MERRETATGSGDQAAGAPAAKPSGYHHGDLRNALLQAAGRLLEAQDPETISFRAVARAAGVSAAAPYHHFASKEELLAALAADGFTRIDAEMRKHAARFTHPADRLLGLGVGYVSWARANPGAYKIMHGQARYLSAETPELAQAAKGSFDLLREHVAAVAALTPGADATREDLIAVAAWSVVHGLAMLIADCAVRPPEGVSLEAYAEDVLRRGLAGLVGSPRGTAP
jgi:AcrR family transcriptional regulator